MPQLFKLYCKGIGFSFQGVIYNHCMHIHTYINAKKCKNIMLISWRLVKVLVAEGSLYSPYVPCRSQPFCTHKWTVFWETTHPSPQRCQPCIGKFASNQQPFREEKVLPNEADPTERCNTRSKNTIDWNIHAIIYVAPSHSAGIPCIYPFKINSLHF